MYLPAPRCSRLVVPSRQSPSRWCCPHQAGFQRQSAGQTVPTATRPSSGQQCLALLQENHPPLREPAASDSFAPARPTRWPEQRPPPDAKIASARDSWVTLKFLPALGINLASRLSVRLTKLLPQT